MTQAPITKLALDEWAKIYDSPTAIPFELKPKGGVFRGLKSLGEAMKYADDVQAFFLAHGIKSPVFVVSGPTSTTRLPFEVVSATSVYAVAYRSEHHCEHQSVCFVYSPSEALADDGAGFWSNEDGWTTLEGATQFSAQEALALSLPHSARGDAFWLGQNRAEGVAAYWAACVADYCGEQADSGQRATRETA